MGLGRLVAHLGLLLILALSSPASADENAAKRPLRVDDYFQMEELGAPTFSPDGQAVAFTRRRPAVSQLTNALVTPETRSDVWLQLAPGRPVKNLTNGAGDESGWWDPKWSPDGQRLAMLSSRGGTVALWVWDRARDAVRQLSPEGVEIEGPSAGCRWLSDRRILCLAVPAGERGAPLTRTGKGLERAVDAWQRARRGQLTASAVNSVEFKRPVCRLILVDLATGRSRVVATIAREGLWLDTWWLSPDARTIAFVEPTASPYPVTYRDAMGLPSSLGLVRLDEEPRRLTGSLPANVLTATLAWSPDGREVAFFALGDATVNPVLLYGEEAAKEVRHEPAASLEQPARLWKVDLETGTVRQVDTGDIDLGRALLPPSFRWTQSGELLFRATPLSERAQAHLQVRPEWLILGRNGETRKLVGGNSEVPNSLESVEGGRAFLGLLRGDVWRVDPAMGTIRNLTESLTPPVQRLDIRRTDQRDVTVLMKAGETGDAFNQWLARRDINFFNWRPKGVEDYVLDPQSGKATVVSEPESGALLVAFDQKSGATAHVVDDNRGTRLWRRTGSGNPERLLMVNSFYQGIIRPEERTIEYTGLNGEALKAKLVLPVDYVPGRRYPLVVDSDIGYVAERTPQRFSPLPWIAPTVKYAFEPGLFAAAGYAYMFVSMPTLTGMDETGRANLLLFTSGLLPAVEKAIALGIADPDRLLLYGESSFGFGVLGVITQTSRFKAAVSRVGWSDQIAIVLSVHPVERYTENPFDRVRMGAPYSSVRLPFWRSGEHDRRNSPLTYVDRVRTPILIMQGELDELPMANTDAFFAALVLQRKAAELVRYWGEDHGFHTPANLRDVHRRIFAWFDRYADISRDAAGRIAFDGNRVKSRNGQLPLTPEDFSRFGPAAETSRPVGTTNLQSGF